MIACPKTYKDNINIAEKWFEDFVMNFAKFYGENKISFNVHNLLHLCDCVRKFGSIDSFSAYKFENYMQCLKKKIRRPSKVLQQLPNRLAEEEIVCKTKSRKNSSIKYRFDEFELNAKKDADSFCCVSGVPIKISEFTSNNSESFVHGYKCLDIQSFFETPINSLTLGILKFKEISPIKAKYAVSQITQIFSNAIRKFECSGSPSSWYIP